MSRDEDQIVEGFLQALDTGEELAAQRSAVDDQGIRRQYEELAGLLPYALDPEIPRPEVKAALMAQIDSPSVELPSTRPATPLAFRGPVVGTRRSPLMLALAAVFALATLGLAAFSAFLYQENQRQEVAIAEVRAALEQGREREQELLLAQSEVAQLRKLVATAATRVCRLKPPPGDPAQPVAKGLVYFHPVQREYFLVAHDLKPCRDGTAYRLWFMVDGRAVGGRSFHVKAGVPVALGSNGMPEGATAILLTLGDEDAEEPVGERVLYGDHSESML